MARKKGERVGREVREGSPSSVGERRKHRRCWQIGRHDPRLSRDLISKHERLMPSVSQVVQ